MSQAIITSQLYCLKCDKEDGEKRPIKIVADPQSIYDQWICEKHGRVHKGYRTIP